MKNLFNVRNKSIKYILMQNYMHLREFVKRTPWMLRIYCKARCITWFFSQLYYYISSFPKLILLYGVFKTVRLYWLDYISKKRKSLINNRISRLFDNMDGNIPGSSKKGWVYHDYALPELGYRAHRKNTAQRLTKLKKHLPIWKAKILDIGCSSGGISMGLALMGADTVIGIDYDKNSIKLATAISEKYEIPNVKFYAEDVANFDNPEVDIIIWLSQWMWVVKQYGLDYGQRLLFEIPKKTNAQIMIFESAADDGKAAIPGTTQKDVERFLKLYSPYSVIKDIGPFKDKWCLRGKKRKVFICSRPRLLIKGKRAIIKRINPNTIVKEYENQCFWAKDIEGRCLKRLENFPHFPKLLDEGSNWLKMEWAGNPITHSSQLSQLKEIAKILKENKIIHRDICPENLLYKNGILYLVDFEWAIVDGIEPPVKPAKNIGRGFYNYGDWDDLKAVEKLLSSFVQKLEA